MQIGDDIPSLTLPPITRRTLALYAGASGDDNPIHIDVDFARQAGLDDVIAHGMLVMAYLGRFVTGWRPQSRLRSFSARFVAVTHVGEALTCRGTVKEILVHGDRQHVAVDLAVVNAAGEAKIAGHATIAFDEEIA
jgi:acyl dehydratase